MNILLDELPRGVQIGAEQIDINTDFRAWVEFETLVEQGESRFDVLFRRLFLNRMPSDLETAAKAALWFFRCGDESERKTEKKPPASTKQGYSFRYDANSIYADFLQFYGIDLITAKLHWFLFRALLAGLPEDSEFKRRIYYRTCDMKNLPKKERERISRIRAQIRIETENKQGITLADRDAHMLEYVKKRTAEAQSGVNFNG